MIVRPTLLPQVAGASASRGARTASWGGRGGRCRCNRNPRRRPLGSKRLRPSTRTGVAISARHLRQVQVAELVPFGHQNQGIGALGQLPGGFAVADLQSGRFWRQAGMAMGS